MAKNTKSSNKNNSYMNFFSQIKWDESYISLVVGVLVVIIIAVLGVFLVNRNKTTDISSTETQVQESETPKEGSTIVSESGEKTYVVKAGDNLWAISENFYKSGYNWVDIAKKNNLSSPDVISAGNKLVIPSVSPKQVTTSAVKPTMTSEGQDISGETYTVKKGDYLWDVAVRAYGDGYSWTKIAKANNLSNPNLIYSGNVLKIPR